MCVPKWADMYMSLACILKDLAKLQLFFKWIEWSAFVPKRLACIYICVCTLHTMLRLDGDIRGGNSNIDKRMGMSERIKNTSNEWQNSNGISCTCT